MLPVRFPVRLGAVCSSTCKLIATNYHLLNGTRKQLLNSDSTAVQVLLRWQPTRISLSIQCEAFNSCYAKTASWGDANEIVKSHQFLASCSVHLARTLSAQCFCGAISRHMRRMRNGLRQAGRERVTEVVREGGVHKLRNLCVFGRSEQECGSQRGVDLIK